MPVQFDSFGVRFLYPDNWVIAERGEEEGDQGATLDVPGGGFVAIERTDADSVDEMIEGIVRAIAADYEDLERESTSLDVLEADTPVIDLRFYYLDLLIVSRLVVLSSSALPDAIDSNEVLLIQMQAESRDFDKNELVFNALLKQIVDAAPSN